MTMLPVQREPATPWWLGDALTAGPRGLELDGIAIADVAHEYGTPIYIYGSKTLRRRVAEIREALVTTRSPFRIHYAMKAARFPPLLALLRREADVAIDASSPREVERALATGFNPVEISVTASMLSDRDLQHFARQGVHLNLDSLWSLRRWAAIRGPHTTVGLRLNPMVRVGWGDDPKLCYGDSKFGFDSETILDAAAYAASLGLSVDVVHMHAGWGIQSSAAPHLEVVFAQLASLSRAIPTVHTINVGGGLCWRQRAEDDPLTVSAWSALLREHLGASGITIACELGTYLTASAGVLVAEVNTVEKRQSGTWVGIDAGHNVNSYAAHYGIPMEIISVARPLAAATETMHVAGNINEANDIFARSRPLPDLQEGELIALYPAGAYGASMASHHCMRDLPAEVLL